MANKPKKRKKSAIKKKKRRMLAKRIKNENFNDIGSLKEGIQERERAIKERDEERSYWNDPLHDY